MCKPGAQLKTQYIKTALTEKWGNVQKEAKKAEPSKKKVGNVVCCLICNRDHSLNMAAST